MLYFFVLYNIYSVELGGKILQVYSKHSVKSIIHLKSLIMATVTQNVLSYDFIKSLIFMYDF